MPVVSEDYSRQYRLPDTLKDWPWSRKINPHHQIVKEEATKWLHSFNAFSPKTQAAFDACDFPLYASLAYYWYNKERLRTCVDTLTLSFVFDEYSDRANASQVRDYADMLMDAMRNPDKPRPEGECVLGEMFRQFWKRGSKTITPVAEKRFIDSVQLYTEGVVQRARDRDCRHKRTITDYFDVRRKTIGGMPAFILMQLDLEIPDEVQYHPLIVHLSDMVIDLNILCNDMCSYNKEQARGDDIHNIVSIVMNDLNVNIHSALAWVEEYHQEIVLRILQLIDNAPWTPENAPETTRYVEGILNWVRANDCWHFESHRYFGKNGLEIQKERMVTLL